jgi:DNA-binding SARP family transcriptional activator
MHAGAQTPRKRWRATVAHVTGLGKSGGVADSPPVGGGGSERERRRAVRLEITLAGDVTVGARPDAKPQLVTGPARVVLAALVVERATGVTRDRLADILWPDGLPKTWGSALRTHVSRVRTLVSNAAGGGGETVVAGDAGYQLVLRPGVEVTVDLDEADDQLAAARLVLADDPVAAQALATQASEVLRAPFLPGHGGAWADDVRARLSDLLLTALELAARAATDAGDSDAAVALAEEVVQRSPLRESAYRSLMAALAGAGNRADALLTYQRLRRMLVDELGIDPSPETEAAYIDLLGPPPAPRAPPGSAGPGAAPGGRGRGTAPTAAPFVGRTAELTTMAEAWELAAGGARHVVVVTGEAGIGKSRLTAEAARAVSDAGGRVLFGRCDQEAIVPYQPVVEALDGLVAAAPDDTLAGLDDEARAELATVLPSIDAPRRAAGPDRARLFGAVTDLVAAAAHERPLLLVLDDLQWADDDTMLLVRHLLRRGGDAPVLVVAICRDHDLDPGHTLADVVHSLDRDGWVRRLPLRGLGEAEVRELLAHLSPEGDIAGAARQLVTETAGNPFLVTELARARATGGAEGGTAIPPGVHDLVNSRLARLGTAAVELLRAGAVAGARFDLDIAGDVAGLDDDTLLDAADAALASGLVTEETPDRYRFPHDIVRRTLVAQLSGARRRTMHRRTADAVERLRAHELDEHAAVLAHHASAGAGPAGDERAVRWARRASAQAAERSAPAEAVRLCRQALAHLPPGDGRLEAEVTTELGIALLAAGDAAGARTLVDGASLAGRHGCHDVLDRAAVALADAAVQRPELRAVARGVLADALMAPGLHTSPDRAPGGDGDGDLPVLHARVLVRHLRLEGPAGERLLGPEGRRAIDALHARIASLTDPGAADERLRLADELSVLAAAAGDPAARIAAAHEQAMAAATLGDAGATGAALAALASVVTTHDDPWGRALLAERTVAELTTDGRLAEAREALAVAVEAVAAHRGARGPDGADAVAARHRAVIDWLAGDGPPDAAHQDAGAGPDATLHDLSMAALAACDSGDRALVDDVRARLAPHADLVCGMGYRTFVGAASFHLGRLAATTSEWAEAERHLQSALRVHNTWAARPWVALTKAALADVLDARARPIDREWIAGLRSEAAWVTRTLGLRSL